MGHLVSKDLYRKLGKKIDGLAMRAPWNDILYQILKDLYTEKEADLVVKMPWGLASIGRICEVSGYAETDAKELLDSLADKGLLIDINLRETWYYSLSPMVIGIFEFTMMRTKGDLKFREWAKLFSEYMNGDPAFLKKNFADGQQMSVLRALPHDGTLAETPHVEILDYEKAQTVIEQNELFSSGICSCRHEKLHNNEKECDTPLDTCTSFGVAAEYMIRHGLAKEISKTEMKEKLAMSREFGLVMSADNVQNGMSYMCHCCGCCCNALGGISKFGYTNTVVSSRFYPEPDPETCVSCGACEKVCPVNAITMKEQESGKLPCIDREVCLGCGVCAVKCRKGALKLKEREKYVTPPESIFERLIVQSLEKGTLQNTMFDNPRSITHKFLRAFVGGFLKLPPLKKSLAQGKLKSRFLAFMKEGVKKQGNGWMLEL